MVLTFVKGLHHYTLWSTAVPASQPTETGSRDSQQTETNEERFALKNLPNYGPIGGPRHHASTSPVTLAWTVTYALSLPSSSWVAKPEGPIKLNPPFTFVTRSYLRDRPIIVCLCHHRGWCMATADQLTAFIKRQRDLLVRERDAETEQSALLLTNCGPKLLEQTGLAILGLGIASINIGLGGIR